jgi:integrase
MTKIRDATGGAFQSRGKFYARVTIAPQKQSAVLLPWCTTLDDAKGRGHALQPLVNQLRQAGEDTWIAKVLEVGATADAAKLAALGQHVAGIVAGKIVKDDGQTPGVETFQTFAEKWTDGELAADYPDDIKVKKSKEKDRYRLEILYKTIGPIPLDKFTLQDAQEAMRKLPAHLEVNTRRHYGQVIRRVLAMAVYPACILPHSPIPKGFVGKPGKEKAKSIPWPSEDARGLGCETWPLEDRMLFGFLPREGMRTGEAAALTWGALSLDVGAVRLDENKTDDPRAWALDPSVARALRLWKAMRTDTAPADLVFKQPDGQALDKDEIAGRYRDYLEKACQARAEILAVQPKGSNRLRVRAHDMRGMFVTYSLAAGRSESWVQDRTGHTTNAMLSRYKRTARTVAELGLGQLAPMTLAIPELAAAFSAANAAADVDEAEEVQEVTTDKYTGGDLNPYASRRWNLNPLRLPFRHPCERARGRADGLQHTAPGGYRNAGYVTRASLHRRTGRRPCAPCRHCPLGWSVGRTVSAARLPWGRRRGRRRRPGARAPIEGASRCRRWRRSVRSRAKAPTRRGRPRRRVVMERVRTTRMQRLRRSSPAQVR